MSIASPRDTTNSPRSIHTPISATVQKDTRPFVYLYKIEFPDDPPKRIRLPKDMKQLLTLATEVLGLTRPAKQVYDSKENPINDIEKIVPKANLYISSVPYKNESFENEPMNTFYLSPKKSPKSPYGKLTPLKQKKVPPKPDDYDIQLQIAANPITVKENLRNSIISLFASLDKDQISNISFSDSIVRMSKETQQYEFDKILLSEHISPTSVVDNTETGQKTINWMLDKIKGLPVEDCKFVITGPSQSGKTTLLSIAAKLFFQKLQIAGELNHFLMFPLNWILYQDKIQNVHKLYHLFVNRTMEILKISRLDLIPIIQPLSNWLNNLICVSGVPPVSANLTHYPEFPTKKLFEYGRHIHAAWQNARGFEGFIKEIINLPNNVAQLFGFQSAIYIFDHFDDCGYEVTPDPQQFPDDSHQPAYLSDVVCEVMKNCPFFIASRSDTRFFNLFLIKQFQQLSTEHLIADNEEKDIFVLQTQIAVSKTMCRGCPAYCALFDRVYNMAAEVTKRAALKSRFSQLKSVADLARNEILKQEFARMCILLAAADTDGNLDEEKMNALMAMDEVSIRVRNP